MCMKDAIGNVCGPQAPITIKIMIDPMGMMGGGGSTSICDRNHSYDPCGGEDPIEKLIMKYLGCADSCPITGKPDDMESCEDKEKKCEM